MMASLESQQIRNTEKLLITIYDSYRKAIATESGKIEIDTKSLRGICRIISEVIRFRKEQCMIPVDGSNGYFYEDINQRHGGYFPVGYHPGGKYISSYGHLNAPELPNYHRIAKYAQIDPEVLDFFNLKDTRPQKTQEPHQAHIMDASSEDGKMDDEILEDEREEVHLMDDIPIGRAGSTSGQKSRRNPKSQNMIAPSVHSETAILGHLTEESDENLEPRFRMVLKLTSKQ
jgi:hypothetical protein